MQHSSRQTAKRLEHILHSTFSRGVKEERVSGTYCDPWDSRGLSAREAADDFIKYETENSNCNRTLASLLWWLLFQMDAFCHQVRSLKHKACADTYLKGDEMVKKMNKQTKTTSHFKN